ncbi:hypothetical protein BC829DRAFT_55270 [Chytridium lagenaria]|nr:hypothetical protein BC829DRAFT_55270 [Chytridium lagenaria]
MENANNAFPSQKSKGGQDVSSENQAASESFMNDEVEGLLLSIGVPKTASDVVKIKAIEEEYHRLLASGSSNQAAEVQNLHMWKVRQVAGGSSKTGDDTSGSKLQSLSRAVEKYKDAVAVNPTSLEANFNLGRVFLTLRDFSTATEYLSKTAALKPTHKEATILMYIAFLHLPNPTLTSPETTIISTDLHHHIHRIILHNALRIKSNFEKSMPDPFTITESIFSPSHPIFSQAFTALSRAYRLLGVTEKSLDTLLTLLHILPDQIHRIPRRGCLFSTLLLKICDTKRLIALHHPTTVPTTLFPTVMATLRIVESSLEASRVHETAAQTCVYVDPGNPGIIATLGDAQLERFDHEGGMDVGLLNDTIGTYEMALEAEEKSDAVVGKVKECLWYKKLVAEVNEVDKLKMTGKAGKTANPAGGAGLKKSTESLKGAGKPSPGVKGKARDERWCAGETDSRHRQKNSSSHGTKIPGQHSIKDGSSKGETGRVSVRVKVESRNYYNKTNTRYQNNRCRKNLQLQASFRNQNPLTNPKPSTHQQKQRELLKKTTPTSSKLNLSKSNNKSKSSPTPSPPTAAISPLYQTRIGLARALHKRFVLQQDQSKIPKEEADKMLEPVKEYYQNAIKLKPDAHDAYIELGPILEKTVSWGAAADLYGSYPFHDLSTSEPTSDDIFLYSEVSRLFIKEKRFKDPNL